MTSTQHPRRTQIIHSGTHKIIRDFDSYKHNMVASTAQEIADHNKAVEQRKRDKLLLKEAKLARQRDAWNNRKLAV